ncbi:hypothetical protein RRG08_055240 [Elysia crispata]|uniref:Uncharacterized protein n=1 Tax=Elysia crispata TaxID=231223 RepID=A0AAE1CMZ6_9GAST|nr:hypothetical protein RRG08_055240 [Elysia crispata]
MTSLNLDMSFPAGSKGRVHDLGYIRLRKTEKTPQPQYCPPFLSCRPVSSDLWRSSPAGPPGARSDLTADQG